MRRIFYLRRKGVYSICYIVVIFLIYLPSASCLGKCLNQSEVNPKKYPLRDGQPISIILETSSRLTHQLSTNVFKIFLEESLGYARIEIKQYEDHFDIDKTISRLTGNLKAEIPDAMINLEVWIPPEYDTVDLEISNEVKDCGNVVSIGGRFSWFIPMELDTAIKRYYNKWSSDTQVIHWSFLRDANVVRYFDLDQYGYSLIKNYSVESLKNNTFFCNHPDCTDGVYIPRKCHHSNCAMLLAPHYESTKFVINHIEEMDLSVKVVWLGDNLLKVFRILKETYLRSDSDKSLLLLNWVPSIVIPNEKDYISVAFKSCELLNSTQTVGCKYDMNRLVKFAWSKIAEVSKPLMETLQKFKFSEAHYEDLLTRYAANPNQDVRTAACEWMKDNPKVLRDWYPKSEATIYIGGIFPITGSVYTGIGIARAAVMARDDINRNKNILPNYNLTLLVNNGKCKADNVMKAFIDYIIENQYPQLIGVLGPACSETVEPLAGVSKHYKTLVISYSAEGSSFSDRSKYPYFFRTIGENRHYKYVYTKFLQTMGWKRVAALTEDGQKYTEYLSHMQDLLQASGISFIANTKFPRERDSSVMRNYLEDLKAKRARIIIADVFDDAARSVMCEAYKLKMTAKEGYIWFLPIWLSSTWYFTNQTYNESENIQYEKVNCSTEEMIQAINGYFSMTHAYYADDNQIMQTNLTIKEWKKKYTAVCGKGGTSNYAGFAYDAVWTYAYAIDKLLKNDPEALGDIHSANTTQKLVKIVNETDFFGVSGHIKFVGGPSRVSNITLMQWYNNRINVIGRFTPTLKNDSTEIIDGRLDLNLSSIKWFTLNGERPGDGELPPQGCAVEGFANLFGVDCQMAIVILNVIVVSLIMLLVAIFVFMVKKRYDQKMQFTENYVKSLGLDVLRPTSDLDKWEVPREDVVINRKLGEGAFGTVYGGEAKLEDGWVAVAVKTLKVGASTEEKVDFLSEAEVMKRFDHKNIIKLLGVVIKSEPLYTIMEFMLYGDLKTFLLARRHLVNSKNSEESEEVSSKKLTSMALDVARGLSYLAQLKYVHRDVASRNCLVNAQRIVKLGDFGMTRPMSENGDYTFNRRGMLPVRWMSPESLALGIFTPASDVWSYGVLLYEIITFGSFPFQGLSNTQVLDYVKDGHTLSIPRGVKPQLEALLKSCWEINVKIRPKAKEIVEFLANNPRLLTPCLDVPIASVQMENSEELEVNMFGAMRKSSSVSYRAQTSKPGIPNGIHPTATASSLPLRQHSVPESENEISIPLENYCPKEPLLGPARSSSSLINFGKLVGIQQQEQAQEDDDDYLTHSPKNGQVVSNV